MVSCKKHRRDSAWPVCQRGSRPSASRVLVAALVDGLAERAGILAEAGLRVLVRVLAADGSASAAAGLADDLAALTIHLAYRVRLRTRLRSTNLLERCPG